MAGYYDPNKDYSTAIETAKKSGASSSEIKRLETERDNKVADKYKGNEPKMYGSDKTYKEAIADNDRDAISNAITIQETKNTSGTSTGVFNGIEYDRTNQGNGVYGVPTSNSTVKNYTQGGVTYQVGPDMSRRTDLKNGYAISNGYTVFYDENGYATRAVKGNADYTPNQDYNASNGTYNKNGAWTDNEMLTKSQLDAIQSYRDAAAAGTMTWADANAKANAIRAGYGYTIDNQGNVTNSGALTAVNDRREQLGLPVNDEDAYAQYYRYLMGTDTSPLAQAGGQVKTFDQFVQENGMNAGSQQAAVKAPASQDLTSVSPYASGISGGSSSTGVSGTSGADGRDPYQYLMDMYAQKNAAQLAALRSTYEQNVADSQAQDDLISAAYDKQRNQTAAQNDLQRMYMNEYGIMRGLNTGASGQMALAQSAAYQGNMAQLSAQEAQSLADNALTREKLAIAYSNAVDQAAAEGDYQLAQALYNEYVRQDELARQDAANAQEQANWEAKFNYQKEQDAWDNAVAQAELLAGFGDFSGYKALGYSDAQIALMQNAWNAQYGTPVTGTTETPGSAPKPKYDNGGLTTSQVKQLQQKLGVTADGKWGSQSSKAAGGLTADEAWKKYGTASYDMSFDELKNTITRYLALGGKQRAQNVLDSKWDSLTSAQQAELSKLFG